MQAPTELVVALAGATLLIIVAASCPRAAGLSVVRQPQAAVHLVPGYKPTLASIRWLYAVQDFDDARTSPSEPRQRALTDRLIGTLKLDSRFTHAHIAGALMLRSAAPAHLDELVQVGRAQRPELPWQRLVLE